MPYQQFTKPNQGETYILGLFKRKENTPYEWEDSPSIQFKGRPANNMEKRMYRIQQGVNGGSDSIFILTTNLPEDIKVKDKVLFMGKEWTVESVGYYFNDAEIINAGIMSEEYIMARCPKGINLQ